MVSKVATRVAIAQCITFAFLFYTFLVTGYAINPDSHTNFEFLQRAILLVSCSFLYPFLLAIMLLYGAIKNNIVILRIWVISCLLVAAIYLLLFSSLAIYISLSIAAHWRIIVLLSPFLLALWMTDGALVVLEYYKEQENISKNLETTKTPI